MRASASPSHTSGSTMRSVEGASPTIFSVSSQTSGWEVYWSQAMQAHLAASTPWGSRMSGTETPMAES